MKRINSVDIARLAGVSRSTVSRVINNYPNVPEETRKKVMEVIKQNHYYPQVSGQLLNGMKSKTIGLFWLSRSSISRDSLSSSFFMNIIDAASRCDYMVLSCMLDNLTDKNNIQFVRKTFMCGRIDAGIFVGASNNDPLIGELIKEGMIIGAFDYYNNDSAANCITANFEQDSGSKIIEYLYSLGHRKIAIIDGDMSRLSSMHRHESFMRGMLQHGLPINNKWLTYGGITFDSGYQAARKLLNDCLDDLPTAICANNDSVAFGVYTACKELGLRIPEDISVVGIDGHANDTIVHPALTTITFDFRKIFDSLVTRVVNTIEEKASEPYECFFEGKLVTRDSCKDISNSN